MNKLVLENVTKKYGKKLALDNCSVQFLSGVNALLGPNGAGKSTIMNIITDLISFDGGRVLWNGEDTKKLKERFRAEVGFMPQNASLYKGFTASDNLRYFGRLKGMRGDDIEAAIPTLLRRVNLSDCAEKKFGSFSGGMKQRLGIATAIMNDPKLLILDEPTAGLDPKERINFRKIIEEISDDTVIILSTHIVSDVELLANRVIFLKDGKIAKCGSADELENRYSSELSKDKTPLETIYMKLFGETDS